MSSRRSFLQKVGAATMGAAVLPGSGSFAASPPATNLLCFFTKHLQWLDFLDTATVLREAGFDGADLTVRPGGHVEPSEIQTQLPKAIEAMDRQGLQVPMVVSHIKSHDDAGLDTFLSTLATHGVKYYRMGYLNYDRQKSMADNIGSFRQTLSLLGEQNEKHGLCGAYQNHAGTRLGASIWDLKESLQGLDPTYMSSQFDVRHATFEGMRSWENDLLAIAQHIRTTALKDFRWKVATGSKKWESENTPLGQGVVDFEAYFDHFGTLGLKDPITIHAEYPILSPEEEQLTKTQKMDLAIERLSRDVSFAKKYLNRV